MSSSSAPSDNNDNGGSNSRPCCPRPHPRALNHGEIEEIFPDVYFVQGTVEMKGALPITMIFQRAMTIVRKGTELVLFNTVRLNEDGLKQLDALGSVKHIVRVAFFHGMDDPFYKERYPNATVWTAENAPYFAQFEPDATPYFYADQTYTNGMDLPFHKATAIVITSGLYPEGLVLLERPEGKVLITGDSLQNYGHGKDPYATYLTRFLMWMKGFTKPYNVGPGWYARSKPDKAEVLALLDHKFDHVLPSHGVPCLGKAYEKYAPSMHSLS